MAEVIEPTERNIERAAAALRDGGVVAVPTETVYGLAGRTLCERAVARIYELKGRPADNPLIAHVLGAEGARRVVAEWPEPAERLAQAFWPGPLTLVLPRGAHVPAKATGGRDTVAVRAPRHPVMRALLHRMQGDPLSAPSANLSGRTSATRAEHVARDFAHVPDLLVLDGGACEVGIESTVVRLAAGGAATVLRPGSVTAERLAEVLGQPVGSAASKGQGDSPGTDWRHYAPATPARLVERGAIARELSASGVPCAVLAVGAAGAAGAGGAASPHVVIPMPETPDAYAAALYDALRRADAAGCARILIEAPAPAGSAAWLAVLDRLARATHA